MDEVEYQQQEPTLEIMSKVMNPSNLLKHACSF